MGSFHALRILVRYERRVRETPPAEGRIGRGLPSAGPRGVSRPARPWRFGLTLSEATGLRSIALL